MGDGVCSVAGDEASVLSWLSSPSQCCLSKRARCVHVAEWHVKKNKSKFGSRVSKHGTQDAGIRAQYTRLRVFKARGTRVKGRVVLSSPDGQLGGGKVMMDSGSAAAYLY